MPLRDHFHSPLDDIRRWESFHATWPVMIVAGLRRRLPRRFYTEIHVHTGTSAEIDVATFESEGDDELSSGNGVDEGGVATAVWAPPRATLAIATDLPAQDVYEVQVYDVKRHRRLVAAVEIVSLSNKDRPEHRRAFIAKCAALLAERVSVVIIDIVTSRTANLYAELLELLGRSDPSLDPELATYASACRMTKREKQWLLEAWAQPLALDRPLPTVPLWLADNLAVPLELEASYEQSRDVLGIP